MRITDVRVRSVSKKESKLKAFVSITLDDALVIHNLKVIEGKNGLFVAMPSKKNNKGEFRDILHPINLETRKMIEDSVLGAYNKELKNNPYSFNTTSPATVPEQETPKDTKDIRPDKKEETGFFSKFK